MRVGTGSPTIQVCLPQSLTHLLRAQLDTHIGQGSFHTAHPGMLGVGRGQAGKVNPCTGTLRFTHSSSDETEDLGSRIPWAL